ncbi:MAG: hypothetical protein OXR84_01065 [Magnetovibrio sp.]|nr:hypothetical protein [Magnetovibrio sp.]
MDHGGGAAHHILENTGIEAGAPGSGLGRRETNGVVAMPKSIFAYIFKYSMRQQVLVFVGTLI